MTTRIQQGKDVNGLPTYDIPFSDTTQSFPLTANSAVTVGVPSNAQTCIFNFSKAADVWVSFVGATSLPTTTPTRLLEDLVHTRLLEDLTHTRLLEGVGGINPANAQILNPDRLFVKPGQSITFVSQGNGFVNLCYYTKTNPSLGMVTG